MIYFMQSLFLLRNHDQVLSQHLLNIDITTRTLCIIFTYIILAIDYLGPFRLKMSSLGMASQF